MLNSGYVQFMDDDIQWPYMIAYVYPISWWYVYGNDVEFLMMTYLFRSM